MEKSILNYDLMRRYTAICVSHLRIPTLEHAEQLGLERKGHVADLIQEDDAGVGQLKHARLAHAPRPGEGSLLVAEEL